MNDRTTESTDHAVTVEPSINRQMAVGAIWMTAARLGVQMLGILSTMILARLLTPEDFGLMALAMSVVALLDTLGQFGFEMPLIHKRDTTRNDYDSAWTLNLIAATLIAALIALSARGASLYFSEPRIEAILYFVAAGHFIASFRSIGTVRFRKELDFRRDFYLQIAQKLSMLAVGLPLAFAMRSYWALVAGIVAGNFSAVVVSHMFAPHRPRLCLSSWRELFAYSKWLQANGVMTFLRDRGYVLVVGRVVDAPSVGLFSIADEIAALPSTALVQPLNRAVFPGFARLANDHSKLRDGYRAMLGLIALVALPAAVGLASVSALAVPVALGPQWVAAGPLLTLLALSGASRTLTAASISVLLAIGQPRLQTVFSAVTALTLLPLVAVGASIGDLSGAAWAFFLHSALLFIPACYWILLRATPIRLSDAWTPIWRPLLAAATMFAVVKPLSDAWASPYFWIALPRLMVMIALGALVYLLIILVLWKLSGCPEGTETALLRRAHLRRQTGTGRTQ